MVHWRYLSQIKKQDLFHENKSLLTKISHTENNRELVYIADTCFRNLLSNQLYTQNVTIAAHVCLHGRAKLYTSITKNIYVKRGCDLNVSRIKKKIHRYLYHEDLDLSINFE